MLFDKTEMSAVAYLLRRRNYNMVSFRYIVFEGENTCCYVILCLIPQRSEARRRHLLDWDL